MFMGPLEMSKPWDENGVNGARKFLDRIFKIYQDKNIVEKENSNLDLIFNQTIKKVTEDYESLNLNTAISQMMIFVNALSKEDIFPLKYAKEFLKLLNPICPFITEELWQKLGNNNTIAYESWPTYDESKLVEDTIEIPIQVNGKLRGKILVGRTASEEEIKQKAVEEVRNYIPDGYKKIIYIPNRIFNIVI